MNKRALVTIKQRHRDKEDERFADGMAIGMIFILMVASAISLYNQFLSPYIHLQ